MVLPENIFKDRLHKHKNSIRYESKKRVPDLSRKYMLCLTEKYHNFFSKLDLLDSQSVLVTKSRQFI